MIAQSRKPHTDGVDARFFPLESGGSKKMLTRGQVGAFNRDGYLFPLDTFSQRELDDTRESFEALLAQFRRAGRNSYSIDGYHTSCRSIYDIATHPRILDYIEDLIGPNIIAWATHYFCKLSGDTKQVAWHQDAVYWPLTPTRTITAWLAIDDVNEENAAMQFVPGSHHLGLLSARDSLAEEQNVLSQVVDDVGLHGKPVTTALRAGQMSLHSDLLLHCSPPNRSSRRRCGLTIRYTVPEVRCLNDWNNRSIWCRGTDPYRHWANNPRPLTDAPDL